MKIYFLDKVLECERDIKAIIQTLKEVEKMALKSNYVISHLEVNGEKIYDNFNHYFSNNLEDINAVKVIAKTPRQLARDLVVYMSEMIEGFIPDIEILANDFRKEATKKSWEELVNVFGGIKWILDAFSTLDSDTELIYIINNYENWNYFAKDTYSLREIMVGFQEILLTDDHDYVPEILSGEIVPLLKDMKDKLDTLVDRKIDLDKLN